jgi:hypothetical protein
MKRTSLVLLAAALTFAACEKKEENTEMTTTAVEPAPAPAPAPAASPADSMAGMSTTGAMAPSTVAPADTAGKSGAQMKKEGKEMMKAGAKKEAKAKS